MTKPIISIFIICVSYSLISCSPTNNISGKYSSNFALGHFFVTRINLNTDSTFGYSSSGHMMFDTSNGHYKLDNKYVTLYHEPFQPDTSEYEKYGKEAVLLSLALYTNKHLNSSDKYLAGHQKLFLCDSSGNIIRKQFRYSNIRQYLIFGKHWYKRRYHLKQVD